MQNAYRNVQRISKLESASSAPGRHKFHFEMGLGRLDIECTFRNARRIWKWAMHFETGPSNFEMGFATLDGFVHSWMDSAFLDGFWGEIFWESWHLTSCSPTAWHVERKPATGGIPSLPKSLPKTNPSRNEDPSRNENPFQNGKTHFEMVGPCTAPSRM